MGNYALVHNLSAQASQPFTWGGERCPAPERNNGTVLNATVWASLETEMGLLDK